MLKTLLSYPRTRGLDINDPKTTQLRRQIIEAKPFLKRVYQEWYARVACELPQHSAPILELGSGAGFLKSFVPNLVTSEVFFCPGIEVVLNGMSLPFADNSLRGIAMIDVLHNVPNVRALFEEATRCVTREAKSFGVPV